MTLANLIWSVGQSDVLHIIRRLETLFVKEADVSGNTVNRLYVWDLPLRLFHWLLLGLVAAATISGQTGGNAMEWHGRFGVALVGLLVFRLTWGLIGSSYARFRTFVRGPSAVIAYLRGEWSGNGHNPLGALSVLAMLLLLTVQVLSGLFANDDIAFRGPYADVVSAHVSALLTGLHKRNFWLLALLIGAHVAAIAYYARIKRENLLTPMIVGYQPVKRLDAATAERGGAAALLLALAIAVGSAWFASGAWMERAALQPAAETPAW